MASWEHADYESQPTIALKISELELHIAEVTANFGPDTTSAGVSRNNSALVPYLAQLQNRLKEYKRIANAGSAFTRGRPL